MKTSDRENLVYLAKLAEQAERFDEMVRKTASENGSFESPHSQKLTIEDFQMNIVKPLQMTRIMS